MVQNQTRHVPFKKLAVRSCDRVYRHTSMQICNQTTRAKKKKPWLAIAYCVIKVCFWSDSQVKDGSHLLLQLYVQKAMSRHFFIAENVTLYVKKSKLQISAKYATFTSAQSLCFSSFSRVTSLVVIKPVGQSQRRVNSTQ